MKNKKLLRLVIIMGIILVFMIGVLLTLIVKQKGKGNTEAISDPEIYTWEEYQALTLEEQMIFPDYFESMDDFNSWYEKNNPENQNIENDVSIPIIDLKGKLPKEWTKEEYEELSPEEQMYFPDYFDSFDEYKIWYNKIYGDN